MRRLIGWPLTAACGAGLVVFAHRMEGGVLAGIVMAGVVLASRYGADADAQHEKMDRALDQALGIAETTKGTTDSAAPSVSLRNSQY